MERTLNVLDYAILLIGATDGIKGHTRTLWELLLKYKIPTFIFVNKMDQTNKSSSEIISELKNGLDTRIIDFSKNKFAKQDIEEIAMQDEELLERYIDHKKIDEEFLKNEELSKLISSRNIFPCFFGSALKLEGVSKLLDSLDKYCAVKEDEEKFSAIVYKISRDDKNTRLTYVKIKNGNLNVKDTIEYNEINNEDNILKEKVNQIRLYSGDKYEGINVAKKGMICALTGLTKTFPNQVLGDTKEAKKALLEPVLSYKVFLEDNDNKILVPCLNELCEEDPMLKVEWIKELDEVQIKVMGEIQLEILKTIIKERFNLDVVFEKASLLYKETIKQKAYGIGHFEPLKHYAEVHLLIEPLKTGEGILYELDCREDVLKLPWQKAIMNALKDKEHTGIFTNSPLTDIKIKVVGGKAHEKHTEGGDFREATNRALRQALRKAGPVLLEPYYEFFIEVPSIYIGKTMTDLDNINAKFELVSKNDEYDSIKGSAPVVLMQEYQKEFKTYTKGLGKIFLIPSNYDVCHNEAEIVDKFKYNPDEDEKNPSSSVFCANGSGYLVEWDKVENFMHLPIQVKEFEEKNKQEKTKPLENKDIKTYPDEFIDDEEVDKIIRNTFYANKGSKTEIKSNYKKKRADIYPQIVTRTYKKVEKKEKYLLIDGYNIIFAWEELKSIAKVSLDGARGRLEDILANYQALKNETLIIVYDAYRVKEHKSEIKKLNNIFIVFTKEAETADRYIEKFSFENKEKYDITVATSDKLEQIIVRGSNSLVMSANDLLEDVKRLEEKLRSEYLDKQKNEKIYIKDM